ncbi:NACHT and WD repeat domain-containing protein [Actinoallomurus acaciae]|uniref:NACHT and WD repeat domain-containing protein n=1 Tax=Actinoallomurus acaciae TaxID=502577 RepID=A0ABV5YA91_9ACTN
MPDVEQSGVRMRRGIRASVTAMTRGAVGVVRRSAPWSIVALLVAGAVTPLVLPALTAAGQAPLLTDGLSGQLGNIGSEYVGSVLVEIVERMRGRGGVSEDAARELITAELLERLEAGDEELQGGLAVLLRSVGGIDAAVTEAVASGSAEVQQLLAEAFTELGAEFEQFTWMLDELDSKIVDIRQDTRSIRDLMAGQRVEQRRQTHLLQRMLLAVNVFGALPPQAAEDGRADEAPPTPVADDGAASPYKGLAAFEPEDAHLFFGREALTATVLARLAERTAGTPGVLVLIGPSGAGKSSLLRAGVLPALARGVLSEGGQARPPWLLITPGEHPVGELAEWTASLAGISAGSVHDDVLADPRRYTRVVRQALRGRADRLVLVVDQFEEVFTQCREEAERRAFVEAVCAAAEDAPALVVIGVRADFYARCAAYPGLVPALQDNQTVEPMSGAEVREAIERPARNAGLTLEPGLMEVLLADLGTGSAEASGQGHAAGALPLLSHALYETWRRRQGGELTVTGYRASGGIAGAVAATAQAIHDDLDDAGREQLRRLFLRLVTVGDGTEDTRRRAGLDELFPGGPDRGLLARLVDARLVTAHESTAEITHEALLSAWPLLRAWLNKDREGRRIHRRLTLDATVWDGLGRDPGSVYRGTRLDVAREWAADPENEADLSPLERDFLQAGIEAHAAEQAAARREVRRLRRLAGGLAATLALALVAGGVAFWQRNTAQHERRTAVGRQLIAQADAVRTSDPATSLRLGLAARRLIPGSQADTDLVGGLTGTAFRGRLEGHTGVPVSVGYSPDGRTLASETEQGQVFLWDTGRAGRPVHVGTLPTVARGTNGYAGLAFSPDGRYLTAARDPETVVFWDVRDRAHPVQAGRVTDASGIEAMAMSRAGHLLATTDGRRTLTLWNVADATHPAVVGTLKGSFDDVALSRDGRTLAGSSHTHGVTLWDLRRRAHPAKKVTLAPGSATAVAFGPDGRTLVTGGEGYSAILWTIDDPSHPTRLATLSGHSAAIGPVAFRPDGRVVAIGGDDRTVMLWDTTDPDQPAKVLRGHTGPVNALAFSPDGRTLASGSADQSVMLWNADTYRPVSLAALGRDDGVDPTFGSALAPDGRTLATATGDTIGLWDLASGRRPTRLSSVAGNDTVVFGPDGRTLAVADGHAVVLWDVRDRTRPARPVRLELSGEATRIAFTADGRALAAGLPGSTTLWDLRDRAHPARRASIENGGGPSFSPDGHTLAVGDAERSAVLWDVRDLARPRRLADLKEPGAVETATAFSPDGRTLAATNAAGSAVLWDIRDLAHPRRGATLTGNVDPVSRMEFGPRGRILATATDGTGPDDVVRLWDVADPARPLQVSALPGSEPIAIEPSGRAIMTAEPASVSVWDIHDLLGIVTDPAAAACSAVGTGLTRKEWAQQVGGLPYRRTCP